MKPTLIILAIIYFLAFTPYAVSYERESYLESELQRTKGCAFAYCPRRVQEKTLNEMNGLYPTQHYEYHSKEWWWSFCTYSPEFCTR